MKLILNVKDSEVAKKIVNLNVDNESLTKDIKILTQNVDKLEKIQTLKSKEAEKYNCATEKNQQLNTQKNILTERVNKLIKDLIV